MKRPRILVTRGTEGSAEFVEALQANGFESVRLPLLDFVDVGEARAIASAITAVGEGWVVVTSLRALRFLLLAAPLVGDAPTRVQVATVGSKSGYAAMDAGFVVPIMAKSAVDLVAEFRSLGSPPAGARQVLWLAGDLVRPELEPRLVALGYEVRKLTVYATKLLRPSNSERDAACDNLAAATFTSPSTVSAFVALVEPAWLTEHRSTLPVVALGATTESALSKAGFRKICVASAPTMRALLFATVRAIEEMK